MFSFDKLLLTGEGHYFLCSIYMSISCYSYKNSSSDTGVVGDICRAEVSTRKTSPTTIVGVDRILPD